MDGLEPAHSYIGRTTENLGRNREYLARRETRTVILNNVQQLSHQKRVNGLRISKQHCYKYSRGLESYNILKIRYRIYYLFYTFIAFFILWLIDITFLVIIVPMRKRKSYANNCFFFFFIICFRSISEKNSERKWWMRENGRLPSNNMRYLLIQ